MKIHNGYLDPTCFYQISPMTDLFGFEIEDEENELYEILNNSGIAAPHDEIVEPAKNN